MEIYSDYDRTEPEIAQEQRGGAPGEDCGPSVALFMAMHLCIHIQRDVQCTYKGLGPKCISERRLGGVGGRYLRVSLCKTAIPLRRPE